MILEEQPHHKLYCIPVSKQGAILKNILKKSRCACGFFQKMILCNNFLVLIELEQQELPFSCILYCF